MSQETSATLINSLMYTVAESIRAVTCLACWVSVSKR